MTVIASNISALRSSNASAAASKALSTSMERLSTGKRINSAKDDAAGLAISSSMTSQIRGMNQSIRNANDGISLAQTADGALDEVTNMLQRVRELSVQAKSGTYSTSDRSNIQTEVSALTDQIKNVLGNTTFNGVKLFDSTGQDVNSTKVNVQVGAGKDDVITLKIDSLDGSKLNATGLNVSGTPESLAALKQMQTDQQTAATNQNNALQTLNDAKTAQAIAKAKDPADTSKDADVVAAQKVIDGDPSATDADLKAGTKKLLDAANLSLSAAQAGADASASTAAATTLTNVDALITGVNTVRAGLGAAQNRLQSVVTTLTTNSTNLSDAKSRIEDADFSTETTALAKAQILSQASTAMLSQANQSSQGVLKLLG